ncbi:MAG: hypothetical protein JOY70_08445 [Acidisphaera sp.]|nr:hypothetical protein [Acidisphaera sp.]MBV9813787.1 hypothetical protein [Acetobacteraceae bacterium]
MSNAEPAANAPVAGQPLVAELKVSGHLMNLDQGLFCIVQAPSSSRDPARGLPGVRISLPPGRSDAITIRSFRDDGWLQNAGDAALVRVERGPAQVLVTVYQAQDAGDPAPSLQVLRLLDAAGGALPAPASRPQPPVSAPAQADVVDVLAHIQGRGDVGGRIGEWMGERGGKRWIEGFALAPLHGIAGDDIEYQGVLGRGWLSPWVEGGQFCGSRGMALPLLGIRVRLRGKAAGAFTCSYAASFVDGTSVGPVSDGQPCESESLAAMEAFQVVIRERAGATAAPSAPAAHAHAGAEPANAPIAGSVRPAPKSKATAPRAAAAKRTPPPPRKRSAPAPKRRTKG